MSDKRNKYDTDPLDPEFARQTEALMGATGNVEGEASTRHLPADEATTRHLVNELAPHTAPPDVPARQEAEAATRRIDGMRTSAFAEPPPPLGDPSLSQPYPSVFAPTAYQPPATGSYYNQTGAPPPPPNTSFAGTGNAPSSRIVAGINLPEKFALVLPYAPFYVGIVAALIELLLVPRRETRVRFHAAQGLALHAAILAISWALTFVGFIARGGRVGATLFSVAAFVFLVVSMLRVWKGEDHRLAPLADATKWLNARLEPRK